LKHEILNIYEKVFEDYLIEVYLKKQPLDSSSKDFQIEFQKKIIEELNDQEIQELHKIIPFHFKNRKLKWDEPFSKKRKLDFYKTKYIPFLKSIKNKIDKTRLKNYPVEIEILKKEYYSFLNQYSNNQIELLKKKSIEYKEQYGLEIDFDEKRRIENLEKEVQRVNDNHQFLELIPSASLLKKTNETQLKYLNKLTEEFNDIYHANKSKLLEYELEVFKIHLEVIIYTPAIDYLIPGRNEEEQKMNDIIAILLI